MSERGEQGRRVLDEALRLLDALQAGAQGQPGPARAAGSDGRAHAGPECAICPVCRGMAHLREANPDAMDRLAGAVVDLGAALRDLLGTAGTAGTAPRPPAASPGGAPDVPPIDVPPTDAPPEDVPRVDVQRIDMTD